jgi:aminoglycoside phosphotransferase (APT) family kinase protein
VIHTDVHIGNWYQTVAGQMGLLDWQVLTRGHWSRDLSYALSTALTVEDRRAWEMDLISLYVERFGQRTGVTIPLESAVVWYRQQLFHALHMWTQTLCHPRLQPNSQRDEMTYELMRRIATAIDDLDAFDAVGVVTS